MSPDDQLQTYRKRHLVIFGETIPLVDKFPWLKKIYEEYGQRQAAEGTLHWDRRLWDCNVHTVRLGSITLDVTFGAMLMQRLRLA